MAKQLKFPFIEDLHQAQRALIRQMLDDWNLVTGRVGKGKSKWARKNARKLDPTFTVNRIHFHEEPFRDRNNVRQPGFWEQYDVLNPGQCIILDEFKGHKRAAMHGERLDLLDRIKRVRSRRVHAFVVYDRVSSLDKDLLTDRNAFWHHLEERFQVQVRQPRTSLRFKPDSTPIEPTSYPLVGDFPFTAWEPPGVEDRYQRKKDDETLLLDDMEEAEESERQRAPVKPNPALVDLAAKELGRHVA